MIHTVELIRTVKFTPYIKSVGIRFTLSVWDTNTTNRDGKHRLKYILWQHTGKPGSAETVALFEGADFCCSPLHAVDSDDTIAALMGFLTLRPGDTDAEYFDDYSEDQLNFCSEHAECLSCEVADRFGEG